MFACGRSSTTAARSSSVTSPSTRSARPAPAARPRGRRRPARAVAQPPRRAIRPAASRSRLLVHVRDESRAGSASTASSPRSWPSRARRRPRRARGRRCLDADGVGDGLHLEGVRDHDAVEAELVAEEALDQRRADVAGASSSVGHEDVGGHDRLHARRRSRPGTAPARPRRRRRATGSSRCESCSVEPWPGKCFAHAATRAAPAGRGRRPRRAARRAPGRSRTSAMPITGFAGSRSRRRPERGPGSRRRRRGRRRSPPRRAPSAPSRRRRRAPRCPGTSCRRPTRAA